MPFRKHNHQEIPSREDDGANNYASCRGGSKRWLRTDPNSPDAIRQTYCRDNCGNKKRVVKYIAVHAF